MADSLAVTDREELRRRLTLLFEASITAATHDYFPPKVQISLELHEAREQVALLMAGPLSVKTLRGVAHTHGVDGSYLTTPQLSGELDLLDAQLELERTLRVRGSYLGHVRALGPIGAEELRQMAATLSKTIDRGPAAHT